MLDDASVIERFCNPENHRLFVIAATAPVIIGGMLAILLIPTIPWLSPVPVVVATLLWWLLDRSFRRPCVEVYDGGILVTNPFNETWVPWSAVADFKGGRFLRIKRSSGGDVTAWAVQSQNLTVVLGKQGYADEVASRLSVLKAKHE